MAVAPLVENLKEELTCSICMDYFTNPVTLGCGHSFCHLCLMQMCREVDQLCSCPECRRAFQTRDLEPNHRLKKLASIAKNLRPYLLNLKDEKVICERHQEEIKIFCEEDQALLCVSCFQTQDHGSHTNKPLDKAAEDSRSKLQEISDYLWKEVEIFQNILAKEQGKEEMWIMEINSWAQNVTAEYERLFYFLRNEEKYYFKRLTQYEKKNMKKLKESEFRLSQHLQNLRMEIFNIEQDFQKPNLQLLLEAGSTMERIKSLLDHYPKPVRKDLPFTIIPGMLEMMKKFRVNLTLDPESASPSLIVSEDLKSVIHGGCLQNVPITLDRFEDDFILGAQAFSSNIHYWEVDVGNSQQWTLGVCKESLSRNADVPLSPGDVFVITCIQDEEGCTVISTPISETLYFGFSIHRVGVFLDFEEGIVCFYNALDGYFIFRSPHFSFSEPLRPIFSPCPPVEGESSIPISIIS